MRRFEPPCRVRLPAQIESRRAQVGFNPKAGPRLLVQDLLL